LKSPQALRNDSGFIMPYRLGHYLGQKQGVLSEGAERVLKDRDRQAKLPLHQLMTVAIGDEAIARLRRAAADVARREQTDGDGDSDLPMDGDSVASEMSSAASSNVPPPSSRGSSSLSPRLLSAGTGSSFFHGAVRSIERAARTRSRSGNFPTQVVEQLFPALPSGHPALFDRLRSPGGRAGAAQCPVVR
jgi:hypothetical protein